MNLTTTTKKSDAHNSSGIKEPVGYPESTKFTVQVECVLLGFDGEMKVLLTKNGDSEHQKWCLMEGLVSLNEQVTLLNEF